MKKPTEMHAVISDRQKEKQGKQAGTTSRSPKNSGPMPQKSSCGLEISRPWERTPPLLSADSRLQKHSARYGQPFVASHIRRLRTNSGNSTRNNTHTPSGLIGRSTIKAWSYRFHALSFSVSANASPHPVSDAGGVRSARRHCAKSQSFSSWLLSAS